MSSISPTRRDSREDCYPDRTEKHPRPEQLDVPDSHSPGDVPPTPCHSSKRRKLTPSPEYQDLGEFFSPNQSVDEPEDGRYIQMLEVPEEFPTRPQETTEGSEPRSKSVSPEPQRESDDKASYNFVRIFSELKDATLTQSFYDPFKRV